MKTFLYSWLAFFLLPLSICLGVNSEIVIDLAPVERSVHSQNGEDGVIEELFRLVGTDSKYCVEFGAYDGVTCSNTLHLRETYGWSGLLLDGSYQNLDINLFQEFITAENINALFEKYQVPENLDFLSIDIDYNDFHVWQALDNKYQPRVVVIEYNATHRPHEDKVVKYIPDMVTDWTNYFGASILAFYRLGRFKGYSLVYAEAMGVNLFFVRDDLLDQLEGVIKNVNNVQQIYRPPQYGMGPRGGHPEDPLKRRYVSSEQILIQQEARP